MSSSLMPQIQDRKFWLEFINEYKDLPCLWDIKNSHYGNRRMRDNALMKLLTKVQKKWPQVDVDFVKQRLNNFRRTFINEYNKVQESKKNGAEDLYVPSLYYYNHLKFLKEEETTKNEVFDIEEEVKDELSKDELQHLGTLIAYTTDGEEDDEYIDSCTSKYDHFDEFCVAESRSEGSKSRKRKRQLQEVLETIDSSEIHTENSCEISDNVVVLNSSSNGKLDEYFEVDVITEAISNIKQQTASHVEDGFDDIARRVATHFRNMNAEQCLLAEKLVFDVCINGRLNRLTTDTSLTLTSSKSTQQGCSDPSSTFNYDKC